MEEDVTQFKLSLGKPVPYNIQFGIWGTQYLESEVHLFARRAIACALFKYHLDDLKEAPEQASMFLNEADIAMDAPQKETETLSLLEQGLIEYPVFTNSLNSFQNYLENLLCIWSVSGYHKQKPTMCAELLIGEYLTMPYVALLGRRVGLEWVSPIIQMKKI